MQLVAKKVESGKIKNEIRGNFVWSLSLSQRIRRPAKPPCSRLSGAGHSETAPKPTTFPDSIIQQEQQQ